MGRPVTSSRTRNRHSTRPTRRCQACVHSMLPGPIRSRVRVRVRVRIRISVRVRISIRGRVRVILGLALASGKI